MYIWNSRRESFSIRKIGPIYGFIQNNYILYENI